MISRSATSGAICTGSVTGSVLTATTMQSGAFVVGQKVIGVGLTPGFTIASFGTGTGANNGGTYNLSGSPGNVSGITIKAVDNTQVVREITSGLTADIVGKWQSWVMKATWGFVPGSGSLTIWRNRRRIFQESGVANAYGHYAGDFPALGTYNPVNWPPSGVPDRVTYCTGMVIGDNSETFLSFTGAAELEQLTPIRIARE